MSIFKSLFGLLGNGEIGLLLPQVPSLISRMWIFFHQYRGLERHEFLLDYSRSWLSVNVGLLDVLIILFLRIEGVLCMFVI